MTLIINKQEILDMIYSDIHEIENIYVGDINYKIVTAIYNEFISSIINSNKNIDIKEI